MSITVPDSESLKSSLMGTVTVVASIENGVEMLPSSAPVSIQGAAAPINNTIPEPTPPNDGFKTLQQEFSLVNIDIPNVTVDDVSTLRGHP